MQTHDKFIGLDVHKDTIVIAIAEGGRGGEERAYGTISNDLHALEKTLRKLGGEGVTLHVVYEAGPTGFVNYRRLTQLQIDCVVVAPSKLPQMSGDKLKTDQVAQKGSGLAVCCRDGPQVLGLRWRGITFSRSAEAET